MWGWVPEHTGPWPPGHCFPSQWPSYTSPGVEEREKEDW